MRKITVIYRRVWQNSCVWVVLKCQGTITEVTNELYHRANPPKMDEWDMALTQCNATEGFPTTIQKGF